MKAVLLHVPDTIKAKLDALRAEGYSLNGYINAVLARELADLRTPSRPRKERRAIR
jgi:hypothetical protein